MTHDLFVTVLGDFGVDAAPGRDHGAAGRHLLRRAGARRAGDEVQRISARPSDAIALAVRLGDSVPIVVDEEVFDEAGVLFEEEQEEDEIEEFRAFLEDITPEDFA